MKKIVNHLMMGLLLLPFLIGILGLNKANAEDTVEATTANVTINKRVFAENKTPANKLNTGEEMPDFGGTPLAGAEFTIYDVTAEYRDLLVDSNQKEVIDSIQKESEQIVPDYAKEIKTVTTDTNGKATFPNLAIKNADGNYNVYLFVETKTPTNVTITKRAVPMVLAMPIYKLDSNQKPTDTINTDIQLYPKNETAKNTKELVNVTNFSDVKIGEKTYKNITTGDTLKYALTVNIPANIGNSAAVESFVIKDTPSAGLSLVNDTVVVGSLVAGTDYTITYADGGFKVTLNLASDKVKALAGKKLALTYDMKLIAEVNPDAIINNQASIQINKDPVQEIETPPTAVVTGGHKFYKTDAHTGDGLAGAEFIVIDAKDTTTPKYATFTINTNKEYVFSAWVDKKEEATKVVSSANGTFGVIGLLNGNYVLNETKAPSENYVRLKDGSITFTVTAGKYEESNLFVRNTPKGLLPSTGGTGIYIFLAIGAALMVGATIWYKKSKETAEV